MRPARPTSSSTPQEDFARRGPASHRRRGRAGGLRLGRPHDLPQGSRVPRAAGHDGALRPVQRSGRHRSIRSCSARTARSSSPVPPWRTTRPRARSCWSARRTCSADVADGVLRVRIGLELPLEEAAEAHRAARGPEHDGQGAAPPVTRPGPGARRRPSWLAEHLDRPAVVVDGSSYLPTSGRDSAAEYAAGHLPGAVFLDLEATQRPRVTASPHAAPSGSLRRRGCRRSASGTTITSWSTTARG